MKLEVLNIKGDKTGRDVELPDELFGIEPNEHVLYLAIKQYLAHQRQGTHKTKERGEVKGSTRKIKRQKGTGTARAGDIKNPLFRGGGRVFGPRPRVYKLKLNKKVKALARRSALASKLKQNQVVIVEDFAFDAPRTKEYQDILENLNLTGKKTLHVTEGIQKNIFLSSKNLSKTKMSLADNWNVYEVVNADCVLLSENSVERIKAAFA